MQNMTLLPLQSVETLSHRNSLDWRAHDGQRPDSPRREQTEASIVSNAHERLTKKKILRATHAH